METPLTVENITPWAGLELGTARSVGQRLTHWATGAPAVNHKAPIILGGSQGTLRFAPVCPSFCHT